ncbi:hypothetical protein CWB76_07350 [Pseudoalteromonas sp. S1609]|uniref:hypothetical protein n=1 Tax=Pseudoalteromonas sp. S1609 TaxID=579505 RepID=UPI00110A148A|nr:hypothetical protein [Pseudoalteromonas sp. S1609]TMP71204.1 hypothetical protein CWB76_07350 [Pseudoalteromonas sp. S1609]
MDIMIPYLGQITRLALESKGAFHIAGVQQSARVKQVELEERKKKEIEKQKKISTTNADEHNKNTDGNDKHLDTWA